MRGDVVYRVYGAHEGRAQDVYFGAFRTREQAQAQVACLNAREMHGGNRAAQYHNRGFVIREHTVETDFEPPPTPKPRDKYFVITSPKPNAPGTWDSTLVEVHVRGLAGAPSQRVCSYERNHAMYATFEPFRQGDRELALVSRHYTRTAVLDLRSGEIIAEESEEKPRGGFCPVGFYVPDWWDVNDDSVIPGSESWDADDEWPMGNFGFVWGCVWGDDSSWKVQYLDLNRVREGILLRDDRFGYVALASHARWSPCFLPSRTEFPSSPPDFISVDKANGIARVEFAVELSFDLGSGKIDDAEHRALIDGWPHG